MPVKSTRFKTQTIFDGEITGLNEREKNVLKKAGIGGTPENVLVAPTGLTKTKLVGVGASGQENIEIGENLTLTNGKLAAAGGDDYYVIKALTLFTSDEVNNLITELAATPEKEEIKVFDKETSVILEGFNAKNKGIIVDLSELTSSDKDFIIFNSGINSTNLGEINASFSWFTGADISPCMNIFTLSMDYNSETDKYRLYRYSIWHSGTTFGKGDSSKCKLVLKYGYIETGGFPQDDTTSVSASFRVAIDLLEYISMETIIVYANGEDNPVMFNVAKDRGSHKYNSVCFNNNDTIYFYYLSDFAITATTNNKYNVTFNVNRKTIPTSTSTTTITFED